MSDRFDARWLALREPFDAASLDGPARDLAHRYADAVRRNPRRRVRVVDLAGGTGANLRATAPLIAGSQHWRLVDIDPALLRQIGPALAAWARRSRMTFRAAGETIEILTPQRTIVVEAVAHDLAVDLAFLPDEDVDGLSAAALLDLVSRDWLAGLAERARAAACPVLLSLNVDGRIAWHPAAPADAQFAQWFCDDLRRDKGFGPALGAVAADAAQVAFGACGFAVTQATRDWYVGADAPAMLSAMLDIFAAAAGRQAPADASPLIAHWIACRRDQAAGGEVALTLGHKDVFATLSA